MQQTGRVAYHTMQRVRTAGSAIGMRLKEEIDANVKIVSGDTTYTAEDRDLLAEFSTQL